jgi:hypothetical protein
VRTIVISLLGLVFASSTASGQSLERCKSISDDSDRLACYDTGFDKPDLAASPNTDVPQTNYDGLYAGLGVVSGPSIPSVYLFNGPGSGVWGFDHESPGPIGYVGYNWAVGDHFILGAEASITGDLFDEPVYFTQLETLQELVVPMAYVRAAIDLDRILFFAKVGAGTSTLRLTHPHDPPITKTGLSSGVGVGAEVNIDRFFVRLEGEARYVFLEPDPPNQYRFGAEDLPIVNYRAGASVGIRFQ